MSRSLVPKHQCQEKHLGWLTYSSCSPLHVHVLRKISHFCFCVLVPVFSGTRQKKRAHISISFKRQRKGGVCGKYISTLLRVPILRCAHEDVIIGLSYSKRSEDRRAKPKPARVAHGMVRLEPHLQLLEPSMNPTKKVTMKIHFLEEIIDIKKRALIEENR